MWKKLMIALSVIAMVATLGLIQGCSENEWPVEPIATDVDRATEDEESCEDLQNGEFREAIPDCNDFPEMLPSGVSVKDVKKFFDAKTDIPMEMLIPEVLEDLGGSYSPEEYYIDTSGLHWGHPKRVADPVALGGCYHPYGLSIVGRFHFVYWFSYRPPSYNAYMAWIPIYAQPYGSNGILVQKRDICWICGCNPICALIWTWICAK